jgi:hypothetical protein
VAELDFGQIIFMVGFIVLLLIRFLRQRARRRPEDPVPDQVVAEEGAAVRLRRQAQAAPAPPPSTPRLSRDRVQESQGPDVGAPLGGGHFIKKSLLETPRDARRGIVLMTILGPCRAFDPPK